MFVLNVGLWLKIPLVLALCGLARMNVWSLRLCGGTRLKAEIHGGSIAPWLHVHIIYRMMNQIVGQLDDSPLILSSLILSQ